MKGERLELPYEDVVLDFTNPETVKWYQEKLGNLIEMGVSAIKVDFGVELINYVKELFSFGNSLSLCDCIILFD